MTHLYFYVVRHRRRAQVDLDIPVPAPAHGGAAEAVLHPADVADLGAFLEAVRQMPHHFGGLADDGGARHVQHPAVAVAVEVEFRVEVEVEDERRTTNGVTRGIVVIRTYVIHKTYIIHLFLPTIYGHVCYGPP